MAGLPILDSLNTDKRVIEPAEVDLDRWRLDLQILAQTAKRHPRSPC